MTHFDLAVLGAGPAGSQAAQTAAARGLSVVVIDEERAAGGQVYRARAPGFGGGNVAGATDAQVGDHLRMGLAASAVTCAFGHRVWHIEPGFVINTVGPDGACAFSADVLIVATGALERHCPIPGWTLPGVFGLAAATVLLKAHGVLPGRRVALAGSGPLLALVAIKILELGGEVSCIVDAAGRRDWLASAAPMLTAPGLAARGAGWLARLAKARVPVFSRHALRRIDGIHSVGAVSFGPVDRDWRPTGGPEQTIAVDAVCTGFGLVPSTDVTRLLQAEHAFNRDTGAWTVRTNPEGMTSVPGLYVCGDAAGVDGAAAAPHSGRLVALCAVQAITNTSGDRAADTRQIQTERRARQRKARFGLAMTRLSVPRFGANSWSDAETIICRCEGVTRSEIETVLGNGASTFNDVKSVTRCGMGACGGRICSEPACALIAHLNDSTREAVGQSTGRSPLRPVVLDDISGSFDYDELAFPHPAPA